MDAINLQKRDQTKQNLGYIIFFSKNATNIFKLITHLRKFHGNTFKIMRKLQRAYKEVCWPEL